MDLGLPVYLMDTIDVADELAEMFKRYEMFGAYYHVRAIAHEMGFHLSGCDGGKRYTAPLDTSEEVRWTA